MHSVKIMSNVSGYGILTTKNFFIKHSLRLVFASWRPRNMTPAVVSQHIWAPFSTIPLSHVGNVLTELFAMFVGDGSHVFMKNIQM